MAWGRSPARTFATELLGIGFCCTGWKEQTWPNEQSPPSAFPLCSFARIARRQRCPVSEALFVRSQCVGESDRAGYSLSGMSRGFVRSHASLGRTKSLCEAQGQVGNSDGLHIAAAVQRLKQGKARQGQQQGLGRRSLPAQRGRRRGTWFKLPSTPWAEPCHRCALLTLCCVPGRMRWRSWCGVVAGLGVVPRCGLQPLAAAPPPLHAIPCWRSPWPNFTSALPLRSLRAKRANEQRYRLIGRAGFVRLLAGRSFLSNDRDGLGEQCERTNEQMV